MLATKTIVIVSSAVILDIQITILYNVRNIEFFSVTVFLDTKSLRLEIKPSVEFLISRVFSPVLNVTSVVLITIFILINQVFVTHNREIVNNFIQTTNTDLLVN